MTDKTKKDKWQAVCACIGVLLVGILIVNVLLIQQIYRQTKPSTTEIKEAELHVTLLEKKDCSECFNATQITEAVKQIPNAKIKSEEVLDYQDKKAKKMIEKYELKQVPAVVITGDVEQIKTEGVDVIKDAIVIYAPPPYYDLKEGKTKGKVQAILLKNSSCDKCIDLSIIISNLKTIGADVELKETDSASDEGKALAEKYKITKIPTLLFTNDLLSYEMIKESWEQAGTVESDGMLVMRQIPPPYLEGEKLVGGVDIVYLTDKTCKECYDAKIHKQIFESTFRMLINSEKEVDVSSTEGKKLVHELKITKIPTIILTGDVDKYTTLAQAWDQLGTVENGKFVFRTMEAIGASYKDLSNGKVVNGTAMQEMTD